MFRLLAMMVFFSGVTACGGAPTDESSSSSNSLESTSSTASSIILSSSKSSSNSSSSIAPTPVSCVDGDAKKVFKDNSCLICHGAQIFASNGGNLNLESGNIGQHMLALASQHHGSVGGQACADELLIDPQNGGNSLLLKLTDPARWAELNKTDCKRKPMPQNGNGLPLKDLQCIESWIEHVIKTENPIIDDPQDKPFAPVGAAEALSKAKYMLHGGAPTADEITALGGSTVSPDKASFKGVIRAWEKTPEYETKIRSFIQLALQQRAPEKPRYLNQFTNIFVKPNIDTKALVVNFDEMFARTAWDIIDKGGDFREIVTTRKWKVTTAILGALAYAELPNQTPGRSFRSFPKGFTNVMHRFEHFQPSDYTDWRTVEFVQSGTPVDWENTAAFGHRMRDIPDGGSLSLRYPRVGFFSTPSFNEIWQTNEDNQFRVSTHQTLIASLDKTFTPSDATTHLTENGIPVEHADKSTVCYQCHRLMDPMRLVFQNYLVTRHRSKVADLSLRPSFSFAGVSKRITTIDDLAKVISEHPDFAKAWVHKLCMWGNSQRCNDSDPEFKRLTNFFKTKNFNFKLLVREFFVSPIFTGTRLVDTHKSNEFLVSLSRSNHFCHAANTRLDKIQMLNNSTGTARLCDARGSFGIISSDVNERGSADFVQSTQVASFDSVSIDRACAGFAGKVFANNDSRIINTRSNNLAAVIDQLTQEFLGIPDNHHRYKPIKNRLTRAYKIASNSTACGMGVNPVKQNPIECGYQLSAIESYKAVWFAACTSPDLIAVGL